MQNRAERSAAGGEFRALRRRERGEGYGEHAIFNDAVGGGGAEENLAQIVFFGDRNVQDFDAEGAAVKVGEGGGHVAPMIEQPSGDGGQTRAGESVEGVEREPASIAQETHEGVRQSLNGGVFRGFHERKNRSGQTILFVQCCERKNSCSSVSTQRRPSRERRTWVESTVRKPSAAKWPSWVAKRCARSTPNFSEK